MAAWSVGAAVSNVVLDTSVVSLIFGGDSRAEYYKAEIAGLRTIVSFQTLEEMWYGACARSWGARRRNDLARHLEQYDIVWPAEELVDICAQLRCDRESEGRRLMNADAWIAATALVLDCPLASHDRDFSGITNLSLIQAPSKLPPPI